MCAVFARNVVRFLSEAEISKRSLAAQSRPETLSRKTKRRNTGETRGMGLRRPYRPWPHRRRPAHARNLSRAIGIRADMDALPIQEVAASPMLRNAGRCTPGMTVMSAWRWRRRACGRLDFDGTVRFIFQPAEENEGGGLAMVEDGLFRDFPVDAVYALHNWPGEDVGTCVARDGAMMAAFAVFEIEVTGKGSHAAMPHEGGDCVVASAHIVSALQTIASGDVSPLRPAVISVTQMHGGDVWNVTGKMAIREHALVRRRGRQDGRRSHEQIVLGREGFVARRDCATTNAIRDNQHAGKRAFHTRTAASPELGLKVLDGAKHGLEDFTFMLQERPVIISAGGRRHGENRVYIRPIMISTTKTADRREFLGNACQNQPYGDYSVARHATRIDLGAVEQHDAMELLTPGTALSWPLRVGSIRARRASECRAIGRQSADRGYGAARRLPLEARRGRSSPKRARSFSNTRNAFMRKAISAEQMDHCAAYSRNAVIFAAGIWRMWSRMVLALFSRIFRRAIRCTAGRHGRHTGWRANSDADISIAYNPQIDTRLRFWPFPGNRFVSSRGRATRFSNKIRLN